MRNNIFKMRLMRSIRRSLLRPWSLPQICYYCGDPATDREHVIPKSIVGDSTPIVWSCRECNLFAGACIFPTIEEKRGFIREKIEKKYKKLINSPEWTLEEAEELGRELRTVINEQMEQKKWITNRLNWNTSLHALIVQNILEQRAIGSDFALTTADQEAIKKSCARLCYTYEN